MAETRVASPNTQGRVNKPPENDSSGLATYSWLISKPTLKLAAVGLAFVALNVVDAYLTNYAHRMATAAGVQQSIEANPFLQSLAGNWALGFKGVVGIAALGLVARVKHFTPDTLFKWLAFGCGVFAFIIVWNLLSLGVI